MTDVDWGEYGEFAIACGKFCLRWGGSEVAGVATDARNLANGRSPKKTKHGWPGGWGMARDIRLDNHDDEYRATAIEWWTKTYPQYHSYVGADYVPGQLHLQGWKYGERPTKERGYREHIST